MNHRIPEWLTQVLQRSRLPLIMMVAGVYVATSLLTRLVLLIINYTDAGAPIAKLAVMFVTGFLLDAWIALGVTLPLAALSMFLTDRWVASCWGRRFLGTLLVAGFFGIIYLGVVEAFFFDEFKSRFNFVAVDYLLYPHEVFVNIWDSYPVPQFLTASLVAALGVFFVLRRSIRSRLNDPSRWRYRATWFLAQSGLLLLGALVLNINMARVSDNRVLNEITANGVHSFFYAAATNELEYDAFYALLPTREAESRARRQILTDDAQFLENDSCRIARHISDMEPERPLNVVLILEESLGSIFVGSLHPGGVDCTPYFDSLVSEGMLFSHVYATGNRTVRGIEASLAGFPPIPGQSVVKRPGGKGLFTLPEVLRAKGYATTFIYGGRSYFDNLGVFAKTNGFDRVIDQSDFTQNTFSTIWGVCDGDLFDNSIRVFDSLHAAGAPFFATLLTVSNHRPYLYPPGHIPYDPAEKRRDFAVRYADYSLHRFLREARAHEFFDSTLFVVLGDHGARVYGSMQIPIESYEIPVLFYSPAFITSATRIDRVGSQMDLPSTILDFLNFDYNSAFFGRSLLRHESGRDWALLSHNRDVALLRDDTLAVLGVRQGKEIWTRDTVGGEFIRCDTAAGSDVLNDAIAYFQTAYAEFFHGRLHPLPQDHLVR